ncbi:MAG: hypothetical protein HQK96_11140 [Nitrospirae bacterium]|nr:hypothetical protein [Nitrospirota bacterium]
MAVQGVAVEDIVYRDDLYPRIEVDHSLIEIYQQDIERLPAIMINQNNILIDGRHRWLAHKRAGANTIPADIIETESEAHLEILAYKYNSAHGKQLSTEEKRIFAVKRCDIISTAKIASILSVSERTVRYWTQAKRKDLEEHRNKLIISEYLRAWNTQEAIAEKFELTQKTVSNIIDNFRKNGNLAESTKNFNPYLYSIWSLKNGDDKSHFGAFPAAYMENLIYYHTEPLEIVYDPFAGSGTTVKVCKAWHRRYYCSDRVVKQGLEDDIKQWDIADGLPEDLPLPDFVFLDPPYWIQAGNKYSKDKECLGNMSLEDFYSTFELFLKELIGRKAKRISIVIAPTQYRNNMVYEDHIFRFAKLLDGKYKIEMRRILPYSTQQCTPQMVIRAKEKRVDLVIHRDLVVWRRV